MDKLDILSNNLGKLFIKYVLNIKEFEFSTIIKGDIKLSPVQLHIVERIYKLIQSERRYNFENNYEINSMYCTIKYLTDGKNSFAHQMHKICGGKEFVYKKTEDPIMNFLGDKLVECYPKLLLDSTILEFITFTEMEEKYIKKIIIQDKIGKMVVDNKNGDERIAFSLTKTGQENVIECISDIKDVFSNIITSSFNNCEYRLNVSPESVFIEIQFAINMLRRISLSKSSTYSIFTGIKGIVFDGFNEIELPSLTIRYIGETCVREKNVAITTVITANKPKNKISGVIAETTHKVKLKKILKRTQFNSYQNVYDNVSMIEADKQITDFNLSVLFTLSELCNITISFQEIGFWIKSSKIDYDFKNHNKTLIIEKEHVSELKKWYNLLQNAVHSTIAEAVNNIKSAVLDEKDVTDSIMNGFYSWEGMFSSNHDTTTSVVKGIAAYIKEDEERISELYDRYRCHKAHGESFKKNESENIYRIKNEVLSIAIKCLKKLLEDNELLKLKPSNRVKRVLINN